MRCGSPQAPNSLSISSSASPRKSDSTPGAPAPSTLEHLGEDLGQLPHRGLAPAASPGRASCGCRTARPGSPGARRRPGTCDSRSPWWKSAPNSVSPSMRASWSLALKSAAVSEANAVGSNVGGSPTVATSWPVRSTISAVRALDSAEEAAEDGVDAAGVRLPRTTSSRRRSPASPHVRVWLPAGAGSSRPRRRSIGWRSHAR